VSLKYIMLGMLCTPHSGYDIKKQFERSLQNFWRAELSQIYPLLGKMQQEGLVKSKAGASDIGPTRRVYKRTAKGRRELVAWLSEGPVVGSERIAFLAQVYFLADLGDEAAAIDFMEQLRSYMVAWLQTLEATESEWRSCNPDYPDNLPDKDFYAHLTLDLGLRKVRANVDWCDDALRRIRKRARRRAAAAAT